MKLSEIYAVADTVAPKRLSDEYCERYGAYDNSGVLVDCGEEIHGVLFSLDLSSAAIDRAIEENCKLIITHHPAIYGKIGNIGVGDTLGEKLVRCIRNGISVIAMHLNLDCAKGGVDECLKEGVCLATGSQEATDETVMHPLQTGGYGRAYTVKKISLAKLQKAMEKEFTTKRILCYGDMEKEISRVASCCGAGVDEETIAFAKAQGADVLISSDFKHHLLALALENGLAVMILQHYASENYGFEKYYEKIRRQLDIPCSYYTDSILL
ncbi:MAG: Nif3-like dinuclear metal center hexameric protein [Clostridia bacterium]|nr:Nif3-like dinuclear metal center hexameric protein [Clostridia bacterium]